jgi:hypothetical protein
MRGLIYPVVFLIASILIGVGFLILRPQSLWAPAVATFSAIAGKVHGRVESHPSPFSRPKAVEKSRSARLQPQRSSASEGSVTVTVIPLPPAVPRRFPLAQEIIKGMNKSSVIASFATPAATVTGADAQLLERLIYLDASSKRTTSIYCVDGKVIRAETYIQ